jgi:hypothetical protein
LNFAGLIAADLVRIGDTDTTLTISAGDLKQVKFRQSTHRLELTEKGRLLIDAWLAGDEEKYRQQLSAPPSGAGAAQPPRPPAPDLPCSSPPPPRASFPLPLPFQGFVSQWSRDNEKAVHAGENQFFLNDLLGQDKRPMVSVVDVESPMRICGPLYLHRLREHEPTEFLYLKLLIDFEAIGEKLRIMPVQRVT